MSKTLAKRDGPVSFGAGLGGKITRERRKGARGVLIAGLDYVMLRVNGEWMFVMVTQHRALLITGLVPVSAMV